MITSSKPQISVISPTLFKKNEVNNQNDKDSASTEIQLPIISPLNPINYVGASVIKSNRLGNNLSIISPVNSIITRSDG